MKHNNHEPATPPAQRATTSASWRARGRMSTTTTGEVADPFEIKRALSAILKPGQVTEVRALDATTAGERYPQIISGYFDDADKAAAAASAIRTAKAVFFIPNPVHTSLLARAVNRIRPAKKEPTTSDGDVIRRHWRC